MYWSGGLASFPIVGDAEHLAVTPRNRVTLHGRMLLNKDVHRHDAPALAVGVLERPLLRNGLGKLP